MADIYNTVPYTHEEWRNLTFDCFFQGHGWPSNISMTAFSSCGELNLSTFEWKEFDCMRIQTLFMHGDDEVGERVTVQAFLDFFLWKYKQKQSVKVVV